LVLLTGTTGYVGGRLLQALERANHRVRCIARRPEFLTNRVGPSTEVKYGDVLDKDSLERSMENVHTAYYLVHSMGAGSSFQEADREAARNFGEAAREAGVRRIIYLGALGDASAELSPHLRSRREVGDVLRESGVQVVEFRASIIIGSGSLSFEMIRALVERLPVMITPRWVLVPAQPIAINDVLEYLLEALDLRVDGNHTFEIGGSDVVSYGDLMREYARQRGLRRIMFSVPVLTPRLSSLWLGLVTPIYARVGRILIDSIRHPTVVTDDSARLMFKVRPTSVQQAIKSAMENEEKDFAETRWSDALCLANRNTDWGGARFGTRLVDSRTASVDAPAEAVFQAIRRLGGAAGWYYGNWLWHLRGFLDLLIGGVGMRRGRRDAEWLRVGDVVDFWRVDALEPDRLLRLEAEMRLPGRAWLQFEVDQSGPKTILRQTAIFDPLGSLGLAYWYASYPLHELVFSGMLRGIIARTFAIRNEKVKSAA
jgi:uncharacterized protein YbjT (DUF2867 family)